MEWRIARLGTHQTVIFAEQELRKYLTQLTPGIEIAVLSETDYISDRKGMLWIGCSAAFREMLPSVEDAVLDDAIYIDVKNGEGIITGTNERSVLLAVYRFLREFGCRWVRPGKLGEIIPHVEYPEQKEIYICEKASYRHRGVCIEGFDSYDHIEQMLDWLPKIGMNSYFIQFMVPYTFFNKWYAHVQNPYMQKQRVTVEEVDGMVTALTEAAKVRSLLLHRVGHGWTCEPFGLAGNGWDAQGNEISEEIRPYLALVNGKRELWNQIALTTNLCYSNPYVRQTISTAVVDYAKSFFDS